MKSLVIGGGIAGLAIAIILRRMGWNTIVEERSRFTDNGIGFIILPNGLAALDKLGVGSKIRKVGKTINKIILQQEDGEILKTEEIENYIAIKRSACIDILRELIPNKCTHAGHEFSHFEYDNTGKAIAAHFKNGVREEADIFIGADGSNSTVRKLIFPSHSIRKAKVKELVGFANAPDIVKQMDTSFIKTYNYELGLAIGLVPCTKQQLIWFVQFDQEKWQVDNKSVQAKKDFVMHNIAQWPDPVKRVFQYCDFEKANIWSTKDMDILPAFHKKNVLLIGDAAHIALPFTSQGTNSALQDAITLGNLLKESPDLTDFELTFKLFYEKRKEELSKYLLFGREMEQHFLHPYSYTTNTTVPFAK